jgi:hypothetical protein
MKYYGKAERVAQQIMAAFDAGNLPKALSQVFIHRLDNVPCRSWSFANQMITAWFGGTSDARGFKQWQQVGRSVVKGTKAFHILAPCTKKVGEVQDTDTGETESLFVITGFKSVPVFRIEDTHVTDHHKWDRAEKSGTEARDWITALPFYNVATAWGITVESYNGQKGKALGYYSSNGTIALGTQNLSTWAHELVHAADGRNGKLWGSDKAPAEVVAEFGGCILLECLGLSTDSDRGGAYEYIKHYSDGKPMQALTKLINRTCEAVALILDTAAEHEPAEIKEILAA